MNLNKEIEIPQGHEAVIEGNKVIIREKESDDNKIREEMMIALTNCLDELIENHGWNYVYVNNKNIPINEVKKWLEKQQEQKPTPDWMPRFLDELRSKKNYFDWDEHRDIEGHILAIINWIAPNYFNRKGKEQKPIKVYDNMDDLIADAMIDEINKSDMRDNEKHNRIYWINKHRQNPTEWSEGEIKLLNSIINDYEEAAKSFCGYDVNILFLKAIRDGEYDLSKQEWSEEDEQFLLVCKNALQKYQSSDKWDAAIIYNWLEKRLKSLKNRRNSQKSNTNSPSWKPSEEQMKALKNCAYGVFQNGYGPALRELYNDLEKLYYE